MATVEKRGKKYRVRYAVYENGERKQYNRSFDSSKDAKAFATEVEYSIQSGTFADAGKLTLRVYFEQYLDAYCMHLRPNTLHSYRRYMERFILPKLGNVCLKDLNTLQIQKLYRDILKMQARKEKYQVIDGKQILVKPASNYTPKTLRNIHGVLSTALRKAVQTRLLSVNPCEYVSLPKPSEKEYVIPNKPQFQVLLRCMQASRYYEPLLAGAILGIRRGEALGLYWSDIDFDSDTIAIRRSLIYNEETHKIEIGEVKTSAGRRTLPLPSVLKTMLNELKDKQRALDTDPTVPFVFVDTLGRPLRPSNVSKEFHRIAEESGLHGMRLHDLRHTVVIYLLEAGQSPKTVQEFIGHTDARFTLRQYAHVVEESKRQSGEVISRLYFPDSGS